MNVCGQARAEARRAPPAAIPVLLVLLPNTLMLDLAGPAEVLRLASQVDAAIGDELGVAPPRFALHYVGPAERVETSIGLPLVGIGPLPGSLPDNAIVVPVGISAQPAPPAGAGTAGQAQAAAEAVVTWLRRVAPMAQRVMCICSGALIAARAGLLDGRQCTTHHSLCAALQALAPAARVLDNRLYVSDGRLSTSAGITAGIDMMLQLLADLAGPRVACAVARNMVVYLRRGGADPQVSPWLTGRNHLHAALHRVQDALGADPARQWSAAQMAHIACSSTRHLTRLFQLYAGVSPLDYLHRLRVAVARELIAQSDLDMEAVAARAGFASARHLRRIWHKFDAAAPSLSRASAAGAKGG